MNLGIHLQNIKIYLETNKNGLEIHKCEEIVSVTMLYEENDHFNLIKCILSSISHMP